MSQRITFGNKVLPYFLLVPQLSIVVVFFIVPGLQAVILSVFREDAFGLSREFVGFANFRRLIEDEYYLDSVLLSFKFSALVMFLTLSLGLFLAVNADRAIRGASFYKTMIIWPYAVAPAVAGSIGMFLFNPTVGVVTHALGQMGYQWNHRLIGRQAFLLVVLAASWRQISYNFVFFLAGLQGIPSSLIEAASIAGAPSRTRFWRIVFPLLTPTTFFLVAMNLIYAFFDTFGVIHQITMGGPNHDTSILVFKVFKDGFIGLDLGGSSAQSVILMLIVIGLTVVQFRFFEKKVEYGS